MSEKTLIKLASIVGATVLASICLVTPVGYTGERITGNELLVVIACVSCITGVSLSSFKERQSATQQV